MTIKLKRDNPCIISVDSIVTKLATPFDLWDNLTKMLYGNVDTDKDEPEDPEVR